MKMDYELLKQIAEKHNDGELFKVACELEKDAGALQMAGEQLVGYARKKGFNTLASRLNTDVGDYVKAGLQKVTNPLAHGSNPGVLASKLKTMPSANAVAKTTASAAPAAKQQMYQMGNHTIDQAAYDRLPKDGMARLRFKPVNK